MLAMGRGARQTSPNGALSNSTVCPMVAQDGSEFLVRPGPSEPPYVTHTLTDHVRKGVCSRWLSDRAGTGGFPLPRAQMSLDTARPRGNG